MMNNYGVGVGGDGDDDQQEDYLSQFEPIPLNFPNGGNGGGEINAGMGGGYAGGNQLPDMSSTIGGGGGGALDVMSSNDLPQASDLTQLSLEEQQRLLIQLQEQEQLLQQQLDQEAAQLSMGGGSSGSSLPAQELRNPTLATSSAHSSASGGAPPSSASASASASMGTTPQMQSPQQQMQQQMPNQMNGNNNTNNTNSMMWPNAAMGNVGVGAMGGMQPQVDLSGLDPQQQQAVQQQLQQHQMLQMQQQQLLLLQQQQQQQVGMGSVGAMGMNMGLPGMGTSMPGVGGGATPTGQVQLMNIAVPGPNDVLCGRGGGANNHEGNIRFRKMVAEQKRRYLTADKRDKPQVARDIVQMWREQDPPGRFLAQDKPGGGPDGANQLQALAALMVQAGGNPSAAALMNFGGSGLWNDIGDKKAREKASQCLRERTPDVIKFIKELEEKKKQEEEQEEEANQKEEGQNDGKDKKDESEDKKDVAEAIPSSNVDAPKASAGEATKQEEEASGESNNKTAPANAAPADQNIKMEDGKPNQPGVSSPDKTTNEEGAAEDSKSAEATKADITREQYAMSVPTAAELGDVFVDDQSMRTSRTTRTKDSDDDQSIQFVSESRAPLNDVPPGAAPIAAATAGEEMVGTLNDVDNKSTYMKSATTLSMGDDMSLGTLGTLGTIGTIDALPVGAAAPAQAAAVSAPAPAPAPAVSAPAALIADGNKPSAVGRRRISETSHFSTESDVTALATNIRRKGSKPQLLQLEEWQQQGSAPAPAGSNASWAQAPESMQMSGITLDGDMTLSGESFLKMIAEEGHGHTEAQQGKLAAPAGRRDSGHSAGSRRSSHRSSGFHDSKISLMSDITDLTALSNELEGLDLNPVGKTDIKSLVDKVSAEAAAEQQQQQQIKDDDEEGGS